MPFLANAQEMFANAQERFGRTLRKFWPDAYNLSSKHNYYSDFGWKAELSFNDFHRLYTRNSIAAAAVDKTVALTWREYPALWEQPDKPAKTPMEERIAAHFEAIGLWRSLMQVDRRAIVGAYAGAILLLRDGRQLHEPVGRLSKIEDVVGIIPAWEGQLEVAERDNNQLSETYSQPTMFQFNEQAVKDGSQPTTQARTAVPIHPDRILIWSEDGTLNGRSDLEPGFNDLVDLDKIKGSGGEGFYKSSRGTLIIEAPAGLTGLDVQKLTGATTPEDAKQKLDEKVDDLASGFDKAALFGGFTAKPLIVTLPQPKEFVEAAMQSFAASMSIPYKELIGNVTGERSSTEDARSWKETGMSRRNNLAIPQINSFVRRLVAWGALPKMTWVVGWASLLDATPDELLERAAKKATINSTNPELVYMVDEIRETGGDAPTDEVEGWDEAEDARVDREAEAQDPPANDDPQEEEAA